MRGGAVSETLQVERRRMGSQDLAEFLSYPLVRAALLFASMSVVLLVGAFILLKFRNRIKDKGTDTGELLTNFREMHSRGDLSDEEYRTIKTQLAARFQDELKDSGQRG